MTQRIVPQYPEKGYGFSKYVNAQNFIGGELRDATGGATLDELKRHAPDWAVADLRQISAAEVCR